MKVEVAKMIRVHRRHPLVRVGEYRRSFLGPCRSTTNIVACVEIRHAVICKNFRDDRSAKGWASALLRSRYCGAMVLAQARRRTSPQAASTRQINLPFCEPFAANRGHAGSRLRLSQCLNISRHLFMSQTTTKILCNHHPRINTSFLYIYLGK